MRGIEVWGNAWGFFANTRRVSFGKIAWKTIQFLARLSSFKVLASFTAIEIETFFFAFWDSID